MKPCEHRLFVILGLVLTRMWCLYEIWKTISLNSQGISRLLILMDELCPAEVASVYSKFHVEKAQAAVENDRIKILQDIRKTIGTQVMTMVIKTNMLSSSVAQVDAIKDNDSR